MEVTNYMTMKCAMQTMTVSKKMEKCTYVKVKNKQNKSYRHWKIMENGYAVPYECQVATVDCLRMFPLWDLDANSATSAFLHAIYALPNWQCCVRPCGAASFVHC